ncbi:MAG TPA: orotate phosphoribosyltransferase [Longimicrobiales bacterium]|nr:orotate phosphoribosyltransferase [Longimicrobiales bacterium]
MRDDLLELLRTHSLRTGEFVLASGQRSDYYIDARVTTMSGRGQQLIGLAALRLLDENRLQPGLVGGLTMGADPVAYAIAHSASLAGRDIDAFSIRKATKAHGTGQRIEGVFDTSRDIVVVEDVVTSGGSALEAVDAVREAGGRVIAVLVVVDRQQGGREHIEATGLPLLALFTVSELLGRAS